MGENCWNFSQYNQFLMEFAPKFLIQFVLKLVKLDLLDVLSTSTTVSSVSTVSLSKVFDVLQKCMRPGFCKTHF